ncbi:MAG: non-heme iron oxygenase ferredoxin subunit [Burkholderiales bacterium]
MQWTLVCSLADLPAGTHRVVDVDGTLIVVANVDGELCAIEDVCTHDGGQLTGGCIDGGEIICPRHGARFSLRTGDALTAPAYEPTAAFPVRIENGIVYTRDPRWD